MNVIANNAIMYILTLLKPKLDKKTDKNQDIENSGKYWMVGDNGDLTFGIPTIDEDELNTMLQEVLV